MYVKGTKIKGVGDSFGPGTLWSEDRLKICSLICGIYGPTILKLRVEEMELDFSA